MWERCTSKHTTADSRPGGTHKEDAVDAVEEAGVADEAWNGKLADRAEEQDDEDEQPCQRPQDLRDWHNEGDGLLSAYVVHVCIM